MPGTNDLNGMMSYSIGDAINVNFPNIEYGVMKYENIIAREVIEDGVHKHIYHIATRTTERLVPKDHMDIIRRHLRGEVAHIDPEGTLDLEYTAYAIVTDEMVKACVTDVFEDISKEIGRIYE